MTPFECWKLYRLLIMHFFTKYDYFVYNKKNDKITRASFETQSEKPYFIKLSEKFRNVAELEEFFLYNIIVKRRFIGDFLMDDGYYHWKAFNNAKEYHFRQDMVIIREYLYQNNMTYEDMFLIKENNGSQYPALLSLVVQNMIRFQTFCIIEKILHFFENFDRIIVEKYVWKEKKKIFEKYLGFLDINTALFENIIHDVIINHTIILEKS